MDRSRNWLLVAEDCESLAMVAKTQDIREMLLAAAARWRRMAKVAQEVDGLPDPNQAPPAGQRPAHR